MKENFTFRLNDALRARIEELRLEKSVRDGRFVSMAEIVVSALDYGLEFVRQDVFTEISLPSHVTSRKQQLIHVATEIFQKGLERLQLHASN